MGPEDPLEKEMATHSSILAWKIPRTEEPVRLQSMQSQRIGHDWVWIKAHPKDCISYRWQIGTWKDARHH